MSATATVSRSSVARYFNGREYIEAAVDELRDGHVIRARDGRLYRGTLFEKTQTNLLHDSADFEGGGWSGGVWTPVSRTSIFGVDGTAREYQNDGATSSNNRVQTRGTLTSNPEVVSGIFENVDTTATRVSIRDQTAGSFVVRADLNWNTGEASVVDNPAGTDPSAGMKYIGTGPSGGDVAEVWARATPSNPGNSRACFFYLTGGGLNTETVIAHHGQVVEAGTPTSPILTASAALNRAAEDITIPFPVSPRALTVYVEMIEMGLLLNASGSQRLLQIGDGGDRLLVKRAGTGTIQYRGELVTAGTNSSASSEPNGPNAKHLDRLELRLLCDDAGAVTLASSLNGGPEEFGATDAAIGLPTSWSTQELILGSNIGGSYGTAFVRRVVVLDGLRTMRECRRVRSDLPTLSGDVTGDPESYSPNLIVYYGEEPARAA